MSFVVKSLNLMHASIWHVVCGKILYVYIPAVYDYWARGRGSKGIHCFPQLEYGPGLPRNTCNQAQTLM